LNQPAIQIAVPVKVSKNLMFNRSAWATLTQEAINPDAVDNIALDSSSYMAVAATIKNYEFKRVKPGGD
jgi:hypothetical protein